MTYDPVRRAFICGRGQRSQTVCDVCDQPVNKYESKVKWRGQEIDLCERCKRKREWEPEYEAWSDRVIAKHHPRATKPDKTN